MTFSCDARGRGSARRVRPPEMSKVTRNVGAERQRAVHARTLEAPVRRATRLRILLVTVLNGGVFDGHNRTALGRTVRRARGLRLLPDRYLAP